MSHLNEQSSLADWVTQKPASSRVFEKYHLDYCCNGERRLLEACRNRNLDFHLMLEELRSIPQDQSMTNAADPSAMSMSELCDHIESTHHKYLRVEIPRLEALIEKVLSVHGKPDSSLHKVREALDSLRSELEPHMLKEEQILFPAIRLLESSESSPGFHFGSIGNPIRMMEHEHDLAGRLLLQIREILNDFEMPKEACNSIREMLEGLQRLEIDLHSHIHKENHILFPQAIYVEKKCRHNSTS
jgi:regulator of cell morphogenesis and NO signaling